MLSIRKATRQDSRPIFEIRNEDDVRLNSFDSRVLTFDHHDTWFENSLLGDQRVIYVIESEHSIIGVVRLDLVLPKSTCEVSVFISKDHWGKGAASFGLLEVEKEIKKHFPECHTIVAKVLSENVGSQHMFSKINYKKKYLVFEKEVL